MEELNKIEKSLNIIFNDLYISLMNNGHYQGHLDKITTYLDPLKNKKFIIGIDDFFYLELRNTKDILLKEGSSKTSYYAPTYLVSNKIIPFACDAGGYLFCFDYRKNNHNPLIVLWIRDNSEGSDIAHLSNSFEEFINTLKTEEELVD